MNETLLFVRVFFAGTALFSLSLANAQDIYISNSLPKDCSSAKDQESKIENQDFAEIQKEYQDAENQYRKDVIACGGGKGAGACMNAAKDRLTAKQRELEQKKSDELDRHAKAMIDINTQYCANGQGSPSTPASGDLASGDSGSGPSASNGLTSAGAGTNDSGGVPSGTGNSPVLKARAEMNNVIPPNTGGVPEENDDNSDSPSSDLFGGQPVSEPSSLPQNAATPAQNQGVDPTLAGLQKAIDALAPHYDLTRPNEGLRVIKDILAGMALGRLIGGVPGAAKAVFGKASQEVGQELAQTGGKLIPGDVPDTLFGGEPAPANGGKPNTLFGGASDAPAVSGEPVEPAWGNNNAPGSNQGFVPRNSWANPPPGVQPPQILRTTPRPAYPQQVANSCVAACTKMVTKTVTRRDLPENFFRQVARGDALRQPNYSPQTGTIPGEIPHMLDVAGVNNSGLVPATIDELASGTAGGYPAIVGTVTASQGHAIVLDAVVGNPGSRSFFIRDPTNPQLVDQLSQNMFRAMGFTNHGVMTEAEFSAIFEGRAVFTKP